MPRSKFSYITTWIFDLDHTLYPPSLLLFDQIGDKMTRYIMDEIGCDEIEAVKLRDRYWHEYGATMTGLMRNHAIDPDHFLDVVHDIKLDHVMPDYGLREAIMALPGRKLIYTNGSRRHAENVTKARGLDGIFDAVHSIECTNYRPKPHLESFNAIIELQKIDTYKATMFEDDPRNLEVPHALGMKTVLIGRADAPHIHHQTDDLTAFLQNIT